MWLPQFFSRTSHNYRPLSGFSAALYDASVRWRASAWSTIGSGYCFPRVIPAPASAFGCAHGAWIAGVCSAASSEAMKGEMPDVFRDFSF